MAGYFSKSGISPYSGAGGVTMKYQHGGSLVIALVMLLVMSIITITNIQSSTMQERMAANNRQKAVAKYAAESALNAAEAWLDANVTSVDALTQFDGSDGLYSAVRISAGMPATPHTQDIADVTNAREWGNTTAAIGVMIGADLVARQPQYIIEYIGRDSRGSASGFRILTDDFSIPDTDSFSKPLFFRITAIGWGLDSRVFSVSESIYKTGSSHFFRY